MYISYLNIFRKYNTIINVYCYSIKTYNPLNIKQFRFSPVPNTEEVEDVEGHSTCELGVASMTTGGGS